MTLRSECAIRQVRAGGTGVPSGLCCLTVCVCVCVCCLSTIRSLSATSDVARRCAVIQKALKYNTHRLLRTLIPQP